MTESIGNSRNQKISPQIVGRETVPSPEAARSFPVCLLGLPLFAPVTEILTSAIRRTNSSKTQRAKYFATACFETLLTAAEDSEIHRFLSNADHLFPSGLPARFASKQFGLSFQNSHSQRTITNQLLDYAEANDKSLFIVGQRPQKHAKPASNISKRRPQLKLAGERWIWPKDWTNKDAFELNKLLQERRPDIILCSLKYIPAKSWMAENGRALAKSIVFELGSSDLLFESITGVRYQNNFHSWLLRPFNRFKFLARFNLQYFKRLGKFIAQNFSQRQVLRSCQRRTQAHPKDALFPRVPAEEFDLITLPSRFDISFLRRFHSEWHQLANATQGVVLNAAAVESFDMMTLGTLLHLTQALQQAGHHLVIQDPPLSLVRFIQHAKLSSSLHTRYNQASAEELARESAWTRAGAVDPTSEAIVWKGNVTAQTIDRIWEDTTGTIKRKEQTTQSFQVDLNKVTLLDSTGIGTMIKLKKRLSKQGYRIAYVNPNQNVRKVLEMTQLSEYLLKD